MATGLDLLLSDQQSANGLDLLLNPPPEVPKPKPVATFAGTKAGGAMQGVRDVENAGAQWLYNLMPEGVRNAGDSADHWLYDKTGGAIGTKPGMTFNNAIANQNAGYEGSRGANGRDGIDWMRALGSGGAQAATAVAGAPARLTAMGAGVLGGALTPVTDMTQGSDATFEGGMGKNVMLGGLLGKSLGVLGNTAADAISPRITAMARQLMDEGVNLSPGQMFGGAAKSLEDKLTSVPIVGDMIRGAQGRAGESLNTAAYGRVLKPLKEAGFTTQMPKGVGREAVDSISTQVSDAYNKLLPKLTTQMDPTFAEQVGHLSEMVKTGNIGEAEGAQFSKIMQTQVLDKFQGQNAITGETLKLMESKLGELAGTYHGQPLGGAIQELQANVRALVQRSNPEHAGQLSKINEAFANLTRVQTAAATQGAPNGVFTAAQLAAAVKSGDKTVRDNAYARGQALMQDLSDPAKSMLTQTTGNSGTADRAMSAGALGALLADPQHLLNPAVLGSVLPAAAVYSAPGQRIINALAQPRSVELQKLAELLRLATDQGTLPATGATMAARR